MSDYVIKAYTLPTTDDGETQTYGKLHPYYGKDICGYIGDVVDTFDDYNTERGFEETLHLIKTDEGYMVVSSLHVFLRHEGLQKWPALKHYREVVRPKWGKK